MPASGAAAPGPTAAGRETSASAGEAAAYLARVLPRLQGDGFAVAENVVYGNLTLRCVAHRSRFELTKFGNSETFFVFAEFPTLDINLLRDFSARCFEYSLKTRSNPLPCGFFESVWCFPVALAHAVESVTTEAVRTRAPPKHWAAGEMPVICDLRTHSVYYFEGTPLWGAAYYAGFRSTIQRLLAPEAARLS